MKLVKTEDDCRRKSKIICPWCGHEHGEETRHETLYDVSEGIDFNCYECGEEFLVTTIATEFEYTTEPFRGWEDYGKEDYDLEERT